MGSPLSMGRVPGCLNKHRNPPHGPKLSFELLVFSMYVLHESDEEQGRSHPVAHQGKAAGPLGHGEVARSLTESEESCHDDKQHCWTSLQRTVVLLPVTQPCSSLLVGNGSPLTQERQGSYLCLGRAVPGSSSEHWPLFTLASIGTLRAL